MTEKLYYNDAYLEKSKAHVLAVKERYDDEHSALILDKTIFFPTGGGQPGDIGTITSLAEGASTSNKDAPYSASVPKTIEISNTIIQRTATGREDIYHLYPSSDDGVISQWAKARTSVEIVLDFSRRYRLMRMHTALHVLCAVVPYPVTGGAIRIDKSHLDFDTSAGGTLDKAQITEKLNALVKQNFTVTTYTLKAADFLEKRRHMPSLVRTASVSPPVDAAGNIRLVQIGPQSNLIDLQACGGTHVRALGEIDFITVKKIENKGKHNRRVRLTID
ncbi:alanine--tRNA ligase [Spirochaetota bacterium]|nr:alanine--tRNA ligase [Spirochaetota bacterium]